MRFSDYYLHETHWTDLYGETFRDFRRRWLKTVRIGDSSPYYCQFTDHANQDIARTPHRQQNHTDMEGVYAYPLKYVLQNPADIWYGRRAKYMRLLRTNSNTRPIHLSTMSRASAEYILHKMGLRGGSYLDFAKKTFKWKNVGQCFIAVVQMKLEEAPTEPTDPKSFPRRSGPEQTALFLKAGYNAVMDSASRNTQAAINNREPEQACFLHRYAFDVVEVVYMGERKQGHGLAAHPAHDEQGRKLVSLLLAAMGGDSITGKSSYMGRDMYWTKKGRRLTIEFRHPNRGWGFGEKKHKYFKLHDDDLAIIDIEYSEKKQVIRRYSSDETFTNIVNDIARVWNSQEANPDFVPETAAEYERKVKEAEEIKRKEREENEKESTRHANEELTGLVKEIGDMLGIKFIPKEGEQYAGKLNIIFSELAPKLNNIWHNKLDTPENVLARYWQRSAQDYEKLKDEPDALEFGYMPEDLSERPDLDALRRIINAAVLKLGRQFYHSNYTAIHQMARELRDMLAT